MMTPDGMSGQLHARLQYPWKRATCNHWKWGWVGPTTGLEPLDMSYFFNMFTLYFVKDTQLSGTVHMKDCRCLGNSIPVHPFGAPHYFTAIHSNNIRLWLGLSSAEVKGLLNIIHITMTGLAYSIKWLCCGLQDLGFQSGRDKRFVCITQFCDDGVKFETLLICIRTLSTVS
jgi:hypothetical protein